MKYTPYDTTVTQEQRKEINQKILYLIDSNQLEAFQISNQDIYNFYTGDGGLHGQNRKDYDNYASYSKAKKEIENGQFFTPPILCRLVAESLCVSPGSLIADLTCGAGAFFNFMPEETNLYGCEIDTKAYKVAGQLYPQARIENRIFVPINQPFVLIILWAILRTICGGGWTRASMFFPNFTTA